MAKVKEEDKKESLNKKLSEEIEVKQRAAQIKEQAKAIAGAV